MLVAGNEHIFTSLSSFGVCMRHLKAVRGPSNQLSNTSVVYVAPQPRLTTTPWRTPYSFPQPAPYVLRNGNRTSVMEQCKRFT